MLKKYVTVLSLVALLMVVLTTSGCYTVLKMRSGSTYHPDYGYYEIYDSWYDPYVYSHPYHYYSYMSWYSSPWTYLYCDPYRTYPYYWRTRYYRHDPQDAVPYTWHKSQRRRGFHTRTTSPRYEPATNTIDSRSSVGEERKELKRLRKVGTGITSKPVRRSGISQSSSTTSRTISRSTPTITRQRSSVSNSSGKTTSTSRSSAPAKRRGSTR